MSRQQFDRRLIEEFERELRDALTIKPSPDFARQVRARIAARPAPPAWWKFAFPIAATCVLAVGLATWMRSSDVPAITTPHVRPRDVQLPTEVLVKAAVAPHEPTGVPRTPSARMRPTPASMPEPEVIVPPDRAEALARFLELARAGVVNEQMLKPIASAPAPAVLEIAPLEVSPIAVPEIETPGAATERGAHRE